MEISQEKQQIYVLYVRDSRARVAVRTKVPLPSAAYKDACRATTIRLAAADRQGESTLL